MFCQKCGSENEEGAKFCATCGNQFSNLESRTEQRTETASTLERKEIKINSEVFSNYWLYIKSTLKAPSQISNDFNNGLITLILFALFLPISLVVFVNHTVKRLSFGFSPVSNVLGFGDVLKGAIITAVIIALYALIIFLTLKIGKLSISYKNIIATLGHMNVPIMLLSAVLIIAPFVGILAYFFILILLSIGMQLANILTIYRLSKGAKVDSLYLAIICQVVFNIVVFVILKEFALETIEEYSSYFDIF
ncbi:zinc-ribbon domain-containing protein [Terrilactibacillus sp. BCM23-1]|uniref:Zinc-ribbon domain-containing protein n=1 Tax=Terrilactibacillus tamarindi TaxID=2599694 RepID=A0A6N8CUQ0_9BACI|nr:zinc ribbon domain-containing protein [Terrilactibacillus tamarindi]MTT32835.1 zinc-ribbon domain-containing protein [Terrilactibacillus tamarindi]